MFHIREDRMKKILLVSITTAVALFVSACGVAVALPKERVVKEINYDNIKSKLPVYPKGHVPYQNILNKSIATVEEGEQNLYDITVTKDLKAAYDGYLNGDGDSALKALKRISSTSKDPKMLWQASFLKAQVLIMMGLGDDALEEIPTCSKYEKESFNSNLNCIALRGELNVWLEDYEGAKKDASSVLLTIGDWEFPISYDRPPSNMDRLVATTTAQMRAYTTLAALYNLTENYKESYYFANEAEKRINAVHYVSNHWFYGKFVNLHLDSYYGRAHNLTFLATSKLALGYDKKEVENDFKNAIDFFEMINYKKGVATVLALKARVYNKIGKHELCYTAGIEAIDYAIESGFLDFVWRIEVLRGETLLNLGRKDEAKQAYRRADETINVLTGALSSDSAKTRFGIGKDEITYNLIDFDIEDKDYSQLFTDLETSRARAFVDMLSKRTIILQRDSQTLKKIQKLDSQIKLQKILNSSNTKAQGVKKLNELLKDRTKKAKLLHETNPKLASAVSIWSSTLAQTQKSLKQDQSMIYFLPTKPTNKLRYLKIKKESAELYTLDMTVNELQYELAKLSEFMGIDNLASARGLKKVSSVKSSTIKEPKKIDAMIESLNKKLTMSQLFDSQKTYIVPSGISNFIPWGMLNTKDEISLLPNGSWLNYKDIKLTPSKKIIIVANPNFWGELPQLKGAEDEGRALAKFYDSNILTSNAASEKNLRQEIKGSADILHLATHGVFYKENPLNSAIYLSKEQNAQAISAKDIFINPLPANLVILSACESGLGKSISGDDMLGLSRSFFLSGAKGVLSSLWEIDDEGSKDFMLTFHKYAKDKNYSLGFLKARKELKEKAYSPAIYGAFILNGTK